MQYVQEKYEKTDHNAAIVRSTRYYNYSDPWHYDSKSELYFGDFDWEQYIKWADKFINE